jgi:hypothetical protein
MNLDSLLIGGSDDCWIWTGQRDKYGYGKARPGQSREHMGVHRYVYELARGPIPTGYTIDHLCENKLCQNPKHLEAVPSGVNVVRSSHTSAGANTRKDSCPQCGGDYECEPRSEGGTRRFCRNCRNAYLREYGRKNRDKTAATRRRWAAKNPDYGREYREKNREKINAYQRERYAAKKAEAL